MAAEVAAVRQRVAQRRAPARRRPWRGSRSRRCARWLVPGAGGRAALVAGLEGLPIVKPPYGVMAAIDVNKGDLLWQVPHGDTPDIVRNHPLLKGMNIPKTGQGGSVGVLITKTLVIAGDPQFTTP